MCHTEFLFAYECSVDAAGTDTCQRQSQLWNKFYPEES